MLLAETVDAVPFGRDNAITAHCVWNRIRTAAEASIIHNLGVLHSAGAIQSEQFTSADGKTIALYWRAS